MKERPEVEHEPLLPETRRLVEEVEGETGRGIFIRADPSVRQQGRAAYVVSDPNPNHHLILIDPRERRFLDHLVAHECGHVLRFARAATSERLVPVMTGERRARAIRQLMPEFRRLVKSGIPEGAIAEVYTIWLSGTISQLSSTPADVYIERWLWQDYPDLHAAQEASLRSQVRTLQLVNRPVVAAFTPESVWRASNAMNYALVKAVAGLLHDRRLLQPYSNKRVRSLGEELFQMVEGSPEAGLAGDRRLADTWATRLGVSHWFEWRRLDELPNGFRHAWE